MVASGGGHRGWWLHPERGGAARGRTPLLPPTNHLGSDRIPPLRNERSSVGLAKVPFWRVVLVLWSYQRGWFGVCVMFPLALLS